MAAVTTIVVSWFVNCVDATVGAFNAQQCIKCAGLKYCTIMNDQYLFDPITGYSRYGLNHRILLGVWPLSGSTTTGGESPLQATNDLDRCCLS
ncbi:unnamed protein product [Phytophthora fragariaefolia]|nr:unnamed protein product [Phytophthora fragariaefolia]